MDDLHEELKQIVLWRCTESEDITEEDDTQKSNGGCGRFSQSSDSYSGYGSSETVVPLTTSSSAITLSATDSGMPRVSGARSWLRRIYILSLNLRG